MLQSINKCSVKVNLFNFVVQVFIFKIYKFSAKSMCNIDIDNFNCYNIRTGRKDYVYHGEYPFMLIQFSTQNHRSIKKNAVIRFAASRWKDLRYRALFSGCILPEKGWKHPEGLSASAYSIVTTIPTPNWIEKVAFIESILYLALIIGRIFAIPVIVILKHVGKGEDGNA